MTCVVGLVAEGKVWMGADSAGVSGWDLRTRADPKLFYAGAPDPVLLIGITTSFRMGQLLRFHLRPKGINREATWAAGKRVDTYNWMVQSFVPDIRKVLKDGGFAKVENQREEGGSFLVGVSGRLFMVGDDFQVAETQCGFDAVGCGAAVAMGALDALHKAPVESLSPAETIESALSASERHNSGVRSPFHVRSLP